MAKTSFSIFPQSSIHILLVGLHVSCLSSTSVFANNGLCSIHGMREAAGAQTGRRGAWYTAEIDPRATMHADPNAAHQSPCQLANFPRPPTSHRAASVQMASRATEYVWYTVHRERKTQRARKSPSIAAAAPAMLSRIVKVTDDVLELAAVADTEVTQCVMYTVDGHQPLSRLLYQLQ